MIDRIQKRLAGWKRKMLLLEARITHGQRSAVIHAYLFPIFLRYSEMGGKGDR